MALKKPLASVTMSVMKSIKLPESERGELNALLIPVILLALLFVGAASFAVWAFGSRQDYKNNSDIKAAAAVAANKQVVQAADAKQYAEAAKSPLKTYIGPEAYGSITVQYPKTWSAYVDTSTNGSLPLDAYFHADYVPATDLKQTYYLRIQVTSQPYNLVLTQYAGVIKQGGATAVPYTLPKVPSVAGMRLDGQVVPGGDNQETGSLVLLPLRDKTLQIWTESTSYLDDFNKYILPNLTFSP